MSGAGAMSAREEVLARVRRALAHGPAGAAPANPAPSGAVDGAAAALPRDYRLADGRPAGELLDLLAERLRDYRSTVRRAGPGGLPAAVAAALAERGARRVAVAPDLALPGLDLRVAPPAGVEIVVDDGLSPAALDRVDGVITTAALAVAETGTIILDGRAGQGRRALTLIPDYHLCVLFADQVVGLVPEAVARLRPDRPLTWISGPSATSDIELSRVEGVHGPRTLDVVLADR